ncbi:hypothetical protein IE81DRAFT_323352 [Ceraceosorus guamensis]|uniref:rRNA-processing protein EFG1 n=1 Tax=Ceraceosorus guamensis TaxID=1522189 RepID=A0A316VYQ5_9BASI|nr:hypothetical protein IE81DRAFT_323352 [Ceraceosorus guamensis]PWN42589.1 hypothetical protein IE81DRAFT_323352 [Ceraceosorus guamensis]
MPYSEGARTRTSQSTSGASKRRKVDATSEAGPSSSFNGSGSSADRGRGRGRARGRGRGRGGGGSRGGRQADGPKRARRQGGHAKSKRGADDADEDDTKPGLSKMKAALRQTKRLLAKDDLPPDARQQAQRRLQALTHDVQTRERENVERENARNSHRARFFERQKLVRRIKQLKTTLSEEEAKDASVIEAQLFEARVRLNYVLNWPHEHPYVALFPARGDAPFVSLDEMISADVSPNRATTNESYSRAHTVRAEMEAAMRRGEMTEPETLLEAGERRVKSGEEAKRRRDETEDRDADDSDEEEGLAADDFFAQGGSDSDEDQA